MGTDSNVLILLFKDKAEVRGKYVDDIDFITILRDDPIFLHKLFSFIIPFTKAKYISVRCEIMYKDPSDEDKFLDKIFEAWDM